MTHFSLHSSTHGSFERVRLVNRSPCIGTYVNGKAHWRIMVAGGVEMAFQSNGFLEKKYKRSASVWSFFKYGMNPKQLA
jgi:hypothetical protein